MAPQEGGQLPRCPRPLLWVSPTCSRRHVSAAHSTSQAALSPAYCCCSRWRARVSSRSSARSSSSSALSAQNSGWVSATCRDTRGALHLTRVRTGTWPAGEGAGRGLWWESAQLGGYWAPWLLEGHQADAAKGSLDEEAGTTDTWSRDGKKLREARGAEPGLPGCSA